MFYVARSNGGWSIRRVTRCCNEPPPPLRLCAWREIAALIVSDARISFRIEHVSEKVHQHEDHGKKENATLHSGQIAPLNREYHVSPDPRPGEYRLRQDAAGQIVADLQFEDGADRQQGVAQRVPAGPAA